MGVETGQRLPEPVIAENFRKACVGAMYLLIRVCVGVKCVVPCVGALQIRQRTLQCHPYMGVHGGSALFFVAVQCPEDCQGQFLIDVLHLHRQRAKHTAIGTHNALNESGIRSEQVVSNDYIHGFDPSNIGSWAGERRDTAITPCPSAPLHFVFSGYTA